MFYSDGKLVITISSVKREEKTSCQELQVFKDTVVPIRIKR
jgi:hypothetical protein